MTVLVYFSPETLANSYIIYRTGFSDATVIDPYSFDLPLFTLLESRGLELSTILLTHTNEFSNLAIKTIRKLYDPCIFAGTSLIDNLIVSNTRELNAIMESELVIYPIPVQMHHQDATMYLIEGSLFCGDVMSAGHVTRCNNVYRRALMTHYLRESLAGMPTNTEIFPLYGPPTTVAFEKLTNEDLFYTVID